MRALLMCLIAWMQFGVAYAEGQLILHDENAQPRVRLELVVRSEPTECGSRLPLRGACILIDATHEAQVIAAYRSQLAAQGWRTRGERDGEWEILRQTSSTACPDTIRMRTDGPLRTSAPPVPNGKILYVFSYAQDATCVLDSLSLGDSLATAPARSQ